MHHPPMTGQARADRELEVIVQRPEEAADELADRSRAVPPPVELVDAPATPDEMETSQMHEENEAREEPPLQVDPPHQRPHP